MGTTQRLSATALAAVAAAAALAGCSSAEQQHGRGHQRAGVGHANPDAAPDTALAGHRQRLQRLGDDQGPAQRIVSLDPTATEDLYAVGAGTRWSPSTRTPTSRPGCR